MPRDDRDPFRRLSAREVPESARWSNSGRRMDDEAARRAERKAQEAALQRAQQKGKDRR
jgi:hypothetical protein